MGANRRGQHALSALLRSTMRKMRQQSGVGRPTGEQGATRDRANPPRLASRRSDVPPFMVMDVMTAAARLEQSGHHVIHMEVGQPAAPAPSMAIAAARAALEGGRLGYTESLGLPSLRRRIARHYQETYGVSVDPATVIVTTGSSAAFTLAFLALLEPADRVALAAPAYPPYRHILTALGCEPVLIAASPRVTLRIDAAGLACGPSGKAAQGRADREPRQSHRNHDERRRARRARRRSRECRHRRHLRRNLSRARLRLSRRRPRFRSPTAASSSIPSPSISA